MRTKGSADTARAVPLLVATAVAVLVASVARSDPAAAAEADYAAALTGPAAPALLAYLRTARVPCREPRGETTCAPASRALGARVHHGRFPGDPALYAVAFLPWQYDPSGNAVDQMAVVVKTLPDGAWAPVGIAPRTVGTEPRDLRFSGRTITYTGTVVGPGDSRADPKGEATFRLEVTHEGVRFVEPSAGPPGFTPDGMARRTR